MFLAALFFSLFFLVLASDQAPAVRRLRVAPALRETMPVAAVVVAAICLSSLFPVVSELRQPAFLPSLAVALFAAMPAAVAKGRARRPVAGATIVLLTLLTFADALYFRFFNSIVPLLGSSNAKQVWNVTASVAALVSWRDLLFLPIAFAGGWLGFSRREPIPEGAERMVRRAFVIALVSSALGTLVVAAGIRDWLSTVRSISVFSWKQRLRETGLFGAHVRDVARAVREALRDGDPPPAERVEAIRRFLEARRVPGEDSFRGAARGKNLILIQVEAFQEWVVDTRVNGVEITPFLNQLRRERALYFSGVWDLTAVSPTADCEYLALNSLHPMPDGSVVFRYADHDFVALPEVLARSGYDTLALHAFERGFWNRAKIYPSYGFARAFFDRELGQGERYGWGLSDKVFFARALDAVDGARQPFFAFLVTLTSHHPFNYLPKHEHRIDTRGLPAMLANYVASMRYVDEALRELFGALATRAYAANTVVALYGDHDAKISLDPAAEADARKALSLAATTLADLAQQNFVTRKVPFFIVLPERTQGAEFESTGGQIDFGPTLLHLFGFEKPLTMLGRPLFSGGGRIVRFDGTVVSGDRVRFPDGACRLLAGSALASEACAPLANVAHEELSVSWTITRHDLAGELSALSDTKSVGRLP